MSSESDPIQRHVLPIPDRPAPGWSPTTRRIPRRRSRRSSRCGRRPVHRTCSSSCSTTSASRASSAFGGPIDDADRGASGGERAQVQPLPHDRALLADAPGAPHRSQPPLGRHGRDHRDRDLCARLQLDPAEHVRAARRDAEAERLLRRRSSASATRCRCGRRARWGRSTPGPPAVRLRALLRLHRRRDEPVRAGDLPGHGADRARPHGRRGLPLHRGHDRPRRSTGSSSRRR